MKDKLIFGAGLVVFVLLLFSLNKNLNKARKVQETIENYKKEIKIDEKTEQELRKEIERQKTNKYIEQRLRNDLFMVKDGEKVVVLPEDSVVENYGAVKKEEIEPLKIPNWKKWLILFNFIKQ